MDARVAEGPSMPLGVLAKIGPQSGNTDGWGWRTNGHMLVAVLGIEQPEHAAPAAPLPRGAHEFVREIVARAAGRIARVDDLRLVAGSVCERCDGARTERCAKLASECDECGYVLDCEEGEYPCSECRRGDGPSRVVRLLGVLLDAQLLACVLRTCPTGAVAVGIEVAPRWGGNVALLSADGWRAAIMGGTFGGPFDGFAVEFTAWEARCPATR